MKVRTYAQQKSALTRKLNAVRKIQRDRPRGYTPPELGAALVALRKECRRTVQEWESVEWANAHRVRQGAWPDDWARWQRALDDAHPWGSSIRLEDA